MPEIEVTPEMIEAGLKAVDKVSYFVTRGYIDADDLVAAYRAMRALEPVRGPANGHTPDMKKAPPAGASGASDARRSGS